MPVTFKYKDKQYTTNNLDSKLIKLGISITDITILSRKDLGEIDNNIRKYTFYNPKTKNVIVSIYNNLKHLQNVIKDIDDFVLKSDY